MPGAHMQFHWLAVTALSLALVPASALAQTREEAAEAADTAAQTRPRTPRIIWQAGVGASYSTGDYGRSVSTDVLSLPVSLRVRRGDWSLRLATSYVSIDGPASVIDTDDGDGVADGGAASGSATERRAGFGDVSLTLGKRFALAETTQITGEVRIKFPTASEAERLTTGTTDVTVRARLSQEVGDVTLRAGGHRRFAGGQGRVAIRDTWAASVGASIDLGDRISAGADLDWAQSAYASGRARTSATAFLSAPLSRRLRLTGYGAAGLSSNAADVTFGASLSLRLD